MQYTKIHPCAECKASMSDIVDITDIYTKN